MTDGLFLFPDAVRRSPAVNAWLLAHGDELGVLAHGWFEALRKCGPDVREPLHDGAPTACVGAAAFAYVNVYRRHAAVGFFRGAELDDPAGLLEGSGKLMRHVKLRTDRVVDGKALLQLIDQAYRNMQQRLARR